jgi:hypothetical protein
MRGLSFSHRWDVTQYILADPPPPHISEEFAYLLSSSEMVAILHHTAHPRKEVHTYVLRVMSKPSILI